MNARSPITTHVLDTARGRPAEGVAVRLEWLDAAGEWSLIGEGITNADGRAAEIVDRVAIAPGVYRLTFATGDYFAAQGTATFFPQVIVEFTVTATSQHYHVPLLLSPFGFSTYRGS